jgi:tRNA modification GTPase
MDNDTIAAIATPLGSGGIGVVRLSGPEAIGVARRILVSKEGTQPFGEEPDCDKIVSHQLRLCYLCDPKQGDVIDEVLAVVMKAPHSYTREDVVEVQSHAGFVVLSRILHAVLDTGVRMAEPGEFTKRAFLNGRIDLSQAEAISEMIAARSEAGAQLAATHLTGGLKSAVNGFMDVLTDIQVELEAGIEFSEDVNSAFDGQRMINVLEDFVIQPVQALLRHYEEGHVYRDGIRLDIVGRPNVGKSSLLNRLLNKDKAIVTSIPGTTRDLVEDQVNISGIPVWITDTAGLHHTEDPIEVIGMQKTRENIERADLVLWVVDAEQGFTDDDLQIHNQIEGRHIVLVVNKVDLLQHKSKFRLPETLSTIDHVFVSAKYGEGIDRLKKVIRDHCLTNIDIDPGRSLVPNLRQKSALDAALACLRQAVEGARQQQAEELVVADVLAAKNALGLITGDRIDEDVMDEIFGRFCIGK